MHVFPSCDCVDHFGVLETARKLYVLNYRNRGDDCISGLFDYAFGNVGAMKISGHKLHFRVEFWFGEKFDDGRGEDLVLKSKSVLRCKCCSVCTLGT